EKKLMEEDFESGQFNHNLDELIQEETEVIEKLRNLAEYHILYSKINYVFRSGGFTRNEEERKVVAEIADHHLIKGKNTAISTRATSICYYTKGLCAASIRDYDDALVNFKKAKLVLDKNPKIKNDLQNRYIYILNFLMQCYIDINDFERAQNLIDEIKDLNTNKHYRSLDSKVKIFTSHTIGSLTLFNRKGEFYKALNIFKSIEEEMGFFEDKLNKEKVLLLNYNKAYALFATDKFKDALKIINDILNDNEKQLRQDIYSFSRIFNLVIHYELNNFNFIEYDSKSTSRYLNKHEKDYKIEKVFMKYIKKLAKEEFAPDKKIIFQNFYDEVDELLKDSQEQVILEYFNVKAWIYSKLKRISFSEAINQIK
ncbi:MAG: tetratricopeptide repeat protein, partial [Putridiphycobacter sp.]